MTNKEIKMSIIPEVKNRFLYDKTVDLNKIKWSFNDKADKRVVVEAYRIRENCENGFPVYINMGNKYCEEYTIEIEDDKAEILSDGANGAFYALQTLKRLLGEHGGIVYCQKICDKPDMKYRGLYHDVSRGKIPTLETLKELVDTIAYYKMNSLQLYIEHTFEFKEYEFCREKLGYLTKDEIKQLDAYCKSKFIDLIPSISTFGHLYHLLAEGKYKHLSELPDYVPQSHYWLERLPHHTIDPTNPESFEVIKSLIDQYLECSSSDTFNICCDETFDLGTGVNKGKDKAKLYVDFVSKIAEYLNQKGKTVMMWGDIILQHSEYINKLPNNIIFLNWCYAKDPQIDNFEKMSQSGKRQIVCPGTSSWDTFSEDVITEESNISKLAEYGYKFNADGLLITNWGDHGNIASITAAMYGIVLSAAVAWNKKIIADKDFRTEVSTQIYGNSETVEIVAKISDIKNVFSWRKVIEGYADEKSKKPYDDYADAIHKMDSICAEIKNLAFSDETIKREMICAAEGFLVVIYLCAKIDGHNIYCDIDFKRWLDEYSELWLVRSKPSELSEVINILNGAWYKSL